MLALIGSACIHNNVRHHTELFEKSNKIKEGKTHSKPATQSHFVKKGEKHFLWKKSPKPLFTLSFKMTTKSKL